MEKIIEERLSDKFFRRYTSRAFFIVMAASVFLWFGKVNGQEWAFVACVFVLMNFVERTASAGKFDGLAKIIEAVKS